MTETARLAALHDYDVLDTPADAELSAVVRAAAVVAGVPNATLNLIDDKRQCQLTTVGFPALDAARDDSMCAVVFQEGRSTHVPDARLDTRFVGNPWVTGDLGLIRFYASAPLITRDGHALGTLCVFDTQPGRLSDTQMTALEGLAGVIIGLFERRRQARRSAELATEAQRQRRLAEEYLRQLQERQELINAVQDTIDVAIVACDAHGRPTLFNRAARDWHGLEPDGDLDADAWYSRYSLYAADGTTPLPSHEVPLHRALRDGTVDGTDIVIARVDRQPMRVRCSGRALTHPDGSPLGAVVTMTDITADHLYRQEITDRERLLSAVLETAPDAFAITDSHGVVTAWNPAAETMFGWSADEAIGERLENLMIPAHLADAHTQGLARRAATGQVRLSSDVVQVPAVRRDGSDLQVELSLGSFGWHGERRFHAFLRDVTEREHARQRLAQANSDLAQANEELDRFTAMIAHDLKSPLTAIAGYTEVLEDTASANRGHQEQAALSAITRATTRMRVMIDDLLDYARAANEPLTLRPVELNPVIDELAAEIRASATRPVRITREHLPTVEAHPTLLRQVLANLLGNAAKYVAPGTTPQVHIGAQTTDSTVTIVVTDNGIGIPPQARERVFTMFHRENTRGFPGNGIGLATCRRIMNRHHGRIWIDRSTERGTTVKLALPRTQPPDRPDDTEHGAARG